jgi:hypothetical protein
VSRISDAGTPAGQERGRVALVAMAHIVVAVLFLRTQVLGRTPNPEHSGVSGYALGTHVFVFPILFHLPAGSWFRSPDRALIVFGLGIGVLCAAGVDTALGQRSPGGIRTNRVVRAWLTALAAVLGLGLVFGDREGRGLLAFYGACGLLALAALTARRRAVRSIGLTVLAAVVLGDLVHARPHRGALPSQVPDYLTRHEPLFAEIRARQGFDRTYVSASFRPPGVLRFHGDLAKAGLNHGSGWRPTTSRSPAAGPTATWPGSVAAIRSAIAGSRSRATTPRYSIS